jgi:hypothetical protein
MSDIYAYRSKPPSIPVTGVYRKKDHGSDPARHSPSSTIRALLAASVTALLLSAVAYLTVRSVLGAGLLQQDNTLLYDITK